MKRNEESPAVVMMIKSILASYDLEVANCYNVSLEDHLAIMEGTLHAEVIIKPAVVKPCAGQKTE